MIVNCPNCTKQLKLSDKVKESVRGLAPGQKIKVKCVHCAVPFGLDSKSLELSTTIGSSQSSKANVQPDSTRIKPPASPDIGWLKDGTFDDKEVVEDIPRALVLMPDTPSREIVVKAASEFGYCVEQAPTAQEAIEKMRFVNYAAVFLHNRYEQGGIRSGKFHEYIRLLDMSRRRYIFYVVIGEQFETLYDLQALACSANLVVNDAEMQYIGTVLKKAIPEYETLFGPLMEEMRVAGK